MTVIYPGSFDPITVGHLDVIKKAVQAFERVIVLVMNNDNKDHMFTQHQRVGKVYRSLEAEGLFGRVVVLSFERWISEFIETKRKETNDDIIIVRGLRNGTDFDYEMSYEQFTTAHKATTVYMTPTPSNAFVSSSLVRNLIRSGGDYGQYVRWK